MMLDRRQFVRALAAGSGYVSASARGAFAQTRYDLIVKGGRVIDPSVRLDDVRDVAVANSRIAAVEANLAATALETIDATGKLVVPGLIDSHVHALGVRG